MIETLDSFSMSYVIGRQCPSPVDFNKFTVFHDAASDQLILYQNNIFFTLALGSSRINNIPLLSSPTSDKNHTPPTAAAFSVGTDICHYTCSVVTRLI